MVVVGISGDTVDDNRAFAEKYGFPFPLLCDEAHEVSVTYGAMKDGAQKTADRITYVISPEGRILHVYPKVVPAVHPQQVLEDLDRPEGRPTPPGHP